MRRFVPLAAMLVAAAVTLAGCGGSSKPSSNNTTSKRQGFGLAMARCMRANGVPNFPDPSSSGGGLQASGNGQTMTINGVPVSAPAFQKAMNKCQSKLPKGPPISAATIARLKAGALKMAECMRSHGVSNFPDPQIEVAPGGHGVGVRIGVGGGPGSGLNPQSPAFERAQQACGHFMGPAFAPKSGSGGGKQTLSKAGS